MGRGRAKAKQTKVARDLKYRSHETDFGALARELHGEQGNGASAEEPDAQEPDVQETDVQETDVQETVDEYDEWSDHSETGSESRR